MTTKLAEAAKIAGASAFSRCLGQGTYDVLLDDRLCDELLTLWNCETLETLRAHVAQTGNRRTAQAFLLAVSAQIGGQRPQATAARPAHSVSPSLG